MKIHHLLFFLFTSAITSAAQKDTLFASGYSYLIVKESLKNDFGSKDTVAKMFRFEKGTKKYLLSHFLYRYAVDCNNVFKDVGKYEFRGDSIVFETIFLQKGSDPIPEKQKQIYKFQTNGKLTLLSDKIYFNNKWVRSKDFFNNILE